MLLWPKGDEPGPGEFPLFADFGEGAETEKKAFLELEAGETVEFYNFKVPENVVRGNPVVITGGVEEGDKMTFTFSGTLSYFHLKGQTPITENVSGKLHFEGEVIDIRPESQGQFSFEKGEIDLADAKLYLWSTGSENGLRYRNYVITDGRYSNDEIIGGTYTLNIYVGIPEDSSFSVGNFPLYYNWAQVPETKRCSSLILYSSNDDDEFKYNTPVGVFNGNPVVISGVMEDGNIMTLEFNGTLTYTLFEGNEGHEESVQGIFSFQGQVEDMTLALSNKRK